MKMLHFVESAGTGENFFPAKNIGQIKVTAADTVVLLFANDDSDISSEIITLTTTSGKSDEVALRLAQEVGAGQIQYGGVLKIIAATAPFAAVSGVVYTAGT